MRQWHDGRAVEFEAASDAADQPADAEQLRDRQPSDGDDQPRSQDAQLPLAPELAQLLLARGGRAVAAARRCAPRVATCHGSAVEGRVELLLVQLEPAAQRAARTAPPRPSLLALH